MLGSLLVGTLHRTGASLLRRAHRLLGTLGCNAFRRGWHFLVARARDETSFFYEF